MTIGTPYDQADYIIESDEGEIASGTTTSNTSATFTLNATSQVTQSGYMDRAKGLRVRAIGSSSIYVFVIMKHAGEYLEIVDSTFLVYPNYQSPLVEEYVYYAIAPDPNFDTMNSYSNFLLVGSHDDTVVRLTPTQNIRLPEDIQTGSDFIDIEKGTTHNVTLNSLQTLLLTSVFDLSGTKIISNKPLTIISGHQCVQVPITTSAACHSVYVHLLPTFNWGQEFILPGLRSPLSYSAQYYKLVAEEGSVVYSDICNLDDDYYYDDGPSIVEGNVFSFQVSVGQNCYMDAGSPVFLIHVGGAKYLSPSIVGDPFLAIVPPITDHVKSASFTSVPSQYSVFMGSNYMLVTVLSEHYNLSQIQIDGGPLNCIWREVYELQHNYDVTIPGYVGTCPMSSGPHTVSHTATNGVLSALVYGWQRGPAVGYSYHPNNNLGMEIIIMEVGLVG